jgi:hypothetical protein
MNRTDINYSLLCIAMAILAIALTIPIAESGVNDDWSYIKTALDLEQTGHLAYNGWSASMLGAQAYWGALFIKLFGFSFLTLRLSTGLLAAGCSAIIYLLHRQINLPPSLAAFGTLTLTLSPVFIPNAASFMTDIPALFLFLASTYGYVRVTNVLDNANTPDNVQHNLPQKNCRLLLWTWLSFALITGILSGTVRQIGWILPVLAPIYLLIRKQAYRRLQFTWIPLATSFLLALVFSIALNTWFESQPFTPHQKILEGILSLSTKSLNDLFKSTAFMMLRLVLTFGVMTLPVLITVPILYKKWLTGQNFKYKYISLFGTLLATSLLMLLAFLLLGNGLFYPWIGNTIVAFPYLTSTAPIPLSEIKLVLPALFWKILALSVLTLVCICVTLRVATLIFPNGKTSKGALLSDIPAPLAMFSLFAVPYVPILLLKMAIPNSFGVFDRYLLPLLPLATIGYLNLYHRWTGRKQLPFAAWLVLALMASYGIAQTHDYFAQLRARLAMTGMLEQQGIPRTRIMAGFEYDSWTQITVAGFYNDPRIENPPGLYIQPQQHIGFNTTYELWKYSPVVRPEYVVSLGRHPELFSSDFPDIKFDCWLPPFQRHITVQINNSPSINRF